ncbi:extracellular solute-binding protein [Fodinisporobacter ferrooxydans]|uniref:Extracellular solute-binding protein n=1 Tax=Fodinisporobacter ferrooxydans TaxID=2901836 RepID=A0ABY4CHY0_9BACL|nr:extracellular solute-binding protein [Alicyclobacillaceae bacterium MYW30-H2]
MNKQGKWGSVGTVVIIMSGLLVGCGSQIASSSAANGSSGNGKIVITMQLQSNTGDASSKQNKSLVDLTKKYEQQHPNVQVQFLPNPYHDISQANAALLTKAAARSAPDIVFEQYGPANSGAIPDGILLNLNTYLNQPDPYIPGNKKWIDAWKSQYIPYMTKKPGEMYILLASAIATEIVYNKEDFAKAGITSTPKTFAEWLDDMKKLQAVGITPFMFNAAGQCNPSWFERKISSSLLAPDLSQFNVNHSQVVTGLGVAVGIKKGIISMKNPTYKAGWQLLDQMKPYLAPGASQYDACAPVNSVSPPLSPVTPFIQNKFAMTWLHTGYLPQLNTLGFAGKYGFFSFPTITKESTPYASGTNVTGVVGGPNGSGEWSVTTQAANATMTPEKTKQVIDYLQYLYSPQNIGPLVKDMGNGAYIPILTGADGGGMPGASDLLPVGAPPKTVDGVIDEGLTNAAHDEGERVLQNYINGTLSFDQFANQWDAILQKAADTWAQTNHVDLSKYTK